MKKFILFLLMLGLCLTGTTGFAQNTYNIMEKVYLSSSGNDANSGTSSQSPLKSFSAAYNKLKEGGEIVLLTDMVYSDTTADYDGNISVKGETSSVKLTLPQTVSIKGNLEIDNVVLVTAATIYANGHKLVIGENATSTSRLTVYGAKASAALNGDTDITLLGGLYTRVYGGGNGGAVNGSTNVVFGGNCNPGDGIDDTASNISPCFIFGGGNNGVVTGKTNITLDGNAVTKFVVGAGSGSNGTAVDTNVYIKGGSVMNVYGGTVGIPSVELNGCNTHVTMTGGVAEALFGGCEGSNLTGNTTVSVYGGEITRRIYTGCYNDWEYSFKSSYYVIGTTTLIMAPGAKVVTNSSFTNRGIFAGSRQKVNSNEINTTIFLDDCYSTYSGKLGEQTTLLKLLYSSSFKNNYKYLVKSGKGGKVSPTGTAGKLYIEPDLGYYGAIGSNVYHNETADISTSVTVSFTKEFGIDSVTPARSESGVSTMVNFVAKNVTDRSNPKLIVGVYDKNDTLMGYEIIPTDTTTTSKSVDIKFNTNSNEKYTVKAMIWDELNNPLCTVYSTEI